MAESVMQAKVKPQTMGLPLRHAPPTLYSLPCKPTSPEALVSPFP
ncbi:unnamed protein product [Penicillium camemberti]|uniref:Str. FM013 n=1 Tax=Penicillium camemberti (strain FM 013) TaxID=1429867 RepID=A0A0G4PGB1_PENC3|nr:unnamed protein product [Penicillium camemberti]